MGTTSPKELLTLWARNGMPVEMAVGYILQNLTKLQATVEANYLKIRQLQSALERLVGKDKMAPKTIRSNKPNKE
jgi:hypothetical protein